MAASITKRASPFAVRQFSIMNQYIFRFVRPTTTLWQWGSSSYRCIHRKCSQNDRELQNIKSKSTKFRRNNQSLTSHGQQGQGQGWRQYDDERGGTKQLHDQIPRSVISTRRRMREHHILFDSYATYSHDWNTEYATYSSTMTSVPQSQIAKNTSTISITGISEIQEPEEDSPGLDNDFFGILNHSVNEIKSSGNHTVENIRLNMTIKRDPKQKFENILTNKHKMDHVETVIELPYGTIRRDRDNLVRSHGNVRAVDYRKTPKQGLSNASSESVCDQIKTNYFDEKYFDPINDPLEKHRLKPECETKRMEGDICEYFPAETSNNTEGHKPEIANNYIEAQYFASESDINPITSKETEQFSYFPTGTNKIVNKNTDAHTSEITENYIDAQYFPNESSIDKNIMKTTIGPITSGGVEPLSLDSLVQEMSQTSPVLGVCESRESDRHGNCRNSASEGYVFNDKYFVGSEKERGSTSRARQAAFIPSELSEDTEKEDGIQSPKLLDAHPDAPKPDSMCTETLYSRFDKHVGGFTKQQLRARNKVKPNVENPETAYDLSLKLRLEKKGKLHKESKVGTSSGKWSGAVDLKGFRKLKDQVLDIQKVPKDVVVRILQDSILHETDEFIAIDKPYGLPSHGGPGVHHSVGKLLQNLAEKIGTEKLDLIHRLDKETTGVMLLAKTSEMAWRLRGLFKERQVVKRYWMITKGIPNPLSGIIDIPIVETERLSTNINPLTLTNCELLRALPKVDGRYRMNVQPLRTEQTQLLIRKQQPDLRRKEAVTNYNVLDSNNGAALVECEPQTGVKHQIRCHVAFGLNTPILGDHKYSHYSKMAPQRLPPEMLTRLGLRQPLVRYVPMHLHAKALVLPQLLADGRNVFIACHLPHHFVQNMKWLKLKPPTGV